MKDFETLFVKLEKLFCLGFFWLVVGFYSHALSAAEGKGEQLVWRGGGLSSQLIGGCSKYVELKG